MVLIYCELIFQWTRWISNWLDQFYASWNKIEQIGFQINLPNLRVEKNSYTMHCLGWRTQNILSNYFRVRVGDQTLFIFYNLKQIWQTQTFYHKVHACKHTLFILNNRINSRDKLNAHILFTNYLSKLWILSIFKRNYDTFVTAWNLNIMVTLFPGELAEFRDSPAAVPGDGDYLPIAFTGCFSGLNITGGGSVMILNS